MPKQHYIFTIDSFMLQFYDLPLTPDGTYRDQASEHHAAKNAATANSLKLPGMSG